MIVPINEEAIPKNDNCGYGFDVVKGGHLKREGV